MTAKKAEASVALTDPARELAELCDGIRQANQQVRGEDHLAEAFGVEPWSLPFYEIIFTILKRIDLVSGIVANLDMDSDYRQEVIGHIEEIKIAFSAAAIRGTWYNNGAAYLSPANVQVLKAVSGQVRQKLGYRRLNVEEIQELEGEIESLLGWLNDHQLSQQDFIRQALIEGLEAFKFRLMRLQWLGWGYTLDSLREVISAYMMLERGSEGVNVNPDAEAALKKTASLIRAVYAKIKTTKEAAEAANWLLAAYGAASLIYQGHPVVKALLR